MNHNHNARSNINGNGQQYGGQFQEPLPSPLRLQFLDACLCQCGSPNAGLGCLISGSDSIVVKEINLSYHNTDI